MTEEQINIAIAEACGWTYCDGWHHPDGGSELQDYVNDLNAMHEAERVLTDDQRWEQVKLIVDYGQAPNGFPLLSRSETLNLHAATARQRAEAFLRTIGKWRR